jgi:hypothetical protein
LASGDTNTPDAIEDTKENQEPATTLVTLTLTNIPEDEEVETIIIRLKNEDTKQTHNITFEKSNNWTASENLLPGEYEMDFYAADNKRTVELASNVLEVKESVTCKAQLEVKKVLNDSFFPKFIRNNGFTLILLIISGIAYLILRQRRLNSTPSTR